MKRQSQFQRSKRPRRCALGTLLLALPLVGIAFQLSAAQAQIQTAPTTPAKVVPKPLAPEVKAKLEKYLAIARAETLCKTQLDLKVENATVQDVIARIQENFPTETIPITTRGVGSPSISFDLKERNVGYLLQQVADRAGGNLYLLSSGLLIAPSSQLTEAERGDVAKEEGGTWAANVESGGNRWHMRSTASLLFALAVAQEVTGSDVQPLLPVKVKTTLATFSPESQAMLQQMAAWILRACRCRSIVCQTGFHASSC